MSEWLTTGQMIDRLQVGERVEAEDGSVAEKLQNGSIQWFDGGATVSMSGINIKSKWRILPQYVSFEKAMNALKEGAVVRAHDEEGGMYEFSPINTFGELASCYSVVTLGQLTELKWTIEK